MKILVTGPEGVPGSNLVRELLRRRYSVSTLIYNESLSRTLDNFLIDKIYGIILFPVDLICFKEHGAVIRCAVSTCIFPAHSKVVVLTNVEGTRYIIKACLEYSVSRLTYIGTANSSALGRSLNHPWVEIIPYTCIKFELDHMDSKRLAHGVDLYDARRRTMQALLINQTLTIGLYDSKPGSGKMILSLYKRKIPGFPKEGKNYITAQKFNRKVNTK
ncbi:NAD-dependent epimerase/dehydratase family protein [Balneola sp. MJW-20]|uniref:NAD-dependent epimerase/dehydratase family protein n=1 Tax=Gracilimonas aurantiaca TaxID=3234185 RepID=UPI003466022C